jgi:hypothetical protein
MTVALSSPTPSHLLTSEPWCLLCFPLCCCHPVGKESGRWGSCSVPFPVVWSLTVAYKLCILHAYSMRKLQTKVLPSCHAHNDKSRTWRVTSSKKSNNSWMLVYRTKNKNFESQLNLSCRRWAARLPHEQSQVLENKEILGAIRTNLLPQFTVGPTELSLHRALWRTVIAMGSKV